MKATSNKLIRVWKKYTEASKQRNKEPFSLDEVFKSMGHIFCPGPFYFFVFDFAKYDFEYVHQDICSVLGPKSINIEDFLNRVHPDDIQFMQSCETAAGKFLFEIIPRSEVTKYKISYCYRVKSDSGDYRLLLQQAMALSTDERGIASRSFGVHTDVTHVISRNNYLMTFQHIHGGNSFFGIDPKKENFLEAPKPKIPNLTKRELQVLKLISEGNTDKEIAEELYLSPNTIRTHRKNIRQKFTCPNTPCVINKAVDLGLI